MNRIAKRLPNALSVARLGLLPILWMFALRGASSAVGIGLIAAGLTDALDGFLARRLDAVSATGAALDSLADNTLILSTAAWIIMLRPDVAVRFGPWLALCVALHVAFLAVGMGRFRRFGNLHLYSAKVAAVIGFAFVVTCFLWPGMPKLLGILAFSAATLAVLESLVCLLVFDRVDENLGSIVRAFRVRGDRGLGPLRDRAPNSGLDTRARMGHGRGVRSPG